MIAVVFNDPTPTNNGSYQLSFNLVDGVLSNNANWQLFVGGAGGSGDQIVFDVNQLAHTLPLLAPVFFNTTTNLWERAIANSEDTLATHVVVAVLDADNFTLGQIGRFTLPAHGYAPGYWFVSETVTGGLVTLSPTISNPVFFVEDADTLHLLSYRPVYNGPTSVSGDKVEFSIHQVGHGFGLLSPVYLDTLTGLWALGQANSEDTLATHVVVEVLGMDDFKVGVLGRFVIPAHGFASGYWFTSDTIPGGLVSDSPVVSNPVFFAESADVIHVLHYRPIYLDIISQDGVLYIPSSATAPVAIPTPRAGSVPLVYETTTDRLWIYSGGWKSVTLS